MQVNSTLPRVHRATDDQELARRMRSALSDPDMVRMVPQVMFVIAAEVALLWLVLSA